MNLTLSPAKAVLGVAAIATLVSVSANSANALNLTLGGTPVTGEGEYSSVAGASTINFNAPAGSPTIPAGVSYTGGAFVTGSSSGEYATPFGDSTQYLTLGGTNPPASSPVTITFTSLLNYFGLYWGSVDTYNSIQFYNGNTLVGSFTGSDVFRMPNGSQDVDGSIYVNFFAQNSGEFFDKIILNSLENGVAKAAFESDNHAYRAVPTPALLPGLLALGAGLLRKRKSEATEEAAEA